MPEKPNKKASDGLSISQVGPLTHPALIRYLADRGIMADVARSYCSEVRFKLNDDREFFAVGFPNIRGGYELRNAFFKGSSSPKDYSHLSNGHHSVMVFEGFMDFLSYLT